ncbi:MAG: hypothetical protein ISS15_05180 [Alphaproteobacteria bacterium]|nr:hypothetical protein [Alphaproteobacteria bacterium]MBL7097032.1 hypothetical protein [Alphaproteobacteria bacterium]
MAEAATEADISSWLELVREVEPLFGPIPMFDTTLTTKIREGDALCVREGDCVTGGMLLARRTTGSAGWQSGAQRGGARRVRS